MIQILPFLLVFATQEADSLWRDTIQTDSGMRIERKFLIKSTGHILSHSIKLNGQYHGKFRNWYPSGKLKSEDTYKHGVMVDSSPSYYETGELSGLTLCDSKGDSCTWANFLRDGKICGGGQSKRGVSVGYSWTKYADGKWSSITERDEIGRYHGLLASWDSLGRPIDSIVYIHGERLRSRHWYANSSQLDNQWSFDSLDVVTRKETPRVREAAWFGPDGKSWGKVVDGNGVLRFFYEGKLDRTDTYKAGVVVKSTQNQNPQYKKKGKR
jgi:hypothetical protein